MGCDGSTKMGVMKTGATAEGRVDGGFNNTDSFSAGDDMGVNPSLAAATGSIGGRWFQ
jgi:hypothetical protein